jgi:3-methyladenine DNA glycosylase/8-oxoguanine DNA glycosylase
MPRTFSLRVPDDYSLSRDFCSYGYFLLAPNRWNVAQQALTRAFAIERVPFSLEITQKHAGTALRVTSTRSLSAKSMAKTRMMLVRMLRLDEEASTIADFHRKDPRWKASGRGRLMRSPTLFEDIIKTVTSCNVTWPSTIQMNRRLCEVLSPPVCRSSPDPHAPFPEAGAVATARVQTLRARCRVGYRDARIVELARLFRAGAVRPAWFEDPTTSDQQILDALIELPGIGPYAAANILQLLGRYSRLPCDSETLRHGTTVLGYQGTPSAINKAVRAHFAPSGPHAFRSYWFELWSHYEFKQGPANMWERESSAKHFTPASSTPRSSTSPQSEGNHSPSRSPTRGTAARQSRG